MHNPSKHNTVLGFDFGMKKIGVAVGQTITQTANPLTILSAKEGVPDWDKISALIKEWNADGLIVGLPLNMDGSEQSITYAAKRFANKLKNHFDLPVYFSDERLTSMEALKWSGNDIKKNKKNLDSLAAKLILESWLHKQEL